MSFSHHPRRAWDRVAPPLPSNESARPFLPSCLAAGMGRDRGWLRNPAPVGGRNPILIINPMKLIVFYSIYSYP